MRRVYVAHAMTTYGTPGAARQMARLGQLFSGSGVELVDPEVQRWRSHDDWREGWERILVDLAALVAFGPAGAGVMQEVLDALFCRVPVAMLHRGGLVELRGVTFYGHRANSPQRTARLVPGRSLSAATLLARGR